MRISDRYQSPVVRPETQPLPAQRRPVPHVEVHVSKRAEQLASGVERASELRASIHDGTFRVDAQAIASVLVGDDSFGGVR